MVDIGSSADGRDGIKGDIVNTWNLGYIGDS